MTVLSESQEAPAERRGFLRPRKWWTRLLSVVLAVVWFVASAIPMIISGTGSNAKGWLFAGLIYLAVWLPLTYMFGVRGTPQVLAVALALSFVAGWLVYDAAPPDHERIHNISRDIGVPRGWQLVSAEESGNTWCWDSCPEVLFDYVTEQDSVAALASFADRAQRKGWKLQGVESRVDTPGDEPDTRERFQRRSVELEVMLPPKSWTRDVRPGDAGKTHVWVSIGSKDR